MDALLIAGTIDSDDSYTAECEMHLQAAREIPVISQTDSGHMLAVNFPYVHTRVPRTPSTDLGYTMNLQRTTLRMQSVSSVESFPSNTFTGRTQVNV